MMCVIYTTEPAVSQLMEDIESLSKEKELLQSEKNNAEKKLEISLSMIENQKVKSMIIY
jgi:hypothetical protein